MGVHGLALEALERCIPHARGQGDAAQVHECDLEGVARDVAENGVPQGIDLAGVLRHGVADADDRLRGALGDRDRLLRDGDGVVGRGLRSERDGLVGLVVELGGVGVGRDVGGHVGGRADHGDDVNGFLDDGGAAGGRDPLSEISTVAVAVEHLADGRVGILGVEAELAIVEAVARLVVGKDAADGCGAVGVDLQLRDVDGRPGADHVGEGAGRLSLLEVAIAEDDPGVVDLFAGRSFCEDDQAGRGDVVVDKCSH